MKLIRPVTITDAVLASSNVTESETAWSAATTYALGNVCYEVVDSVHQKFTSKQNSNLNHQPSLDTTETWWTANGPTNRWEMFDVAIQSQTTRADSIVVQLDLPASERVDTVALLNLAGSAAQVTITDATDGVVYDQTHSLVSPSGITDWYAYFFEPIARLRDLVLTELPPYAGAVIDVSITETGATVACGVLLVGFSKSLGGARWGAQLGIRDYSVKDEDAFGNLGVVERAYRKRASFSVILPNGFLDELVTLLADYRATPALWVGSGDYAAMAIWGFVKDWSVEVPYPDRSLCSLEIESLT